MNILVKKVRGGLIFIFMDMIQFLGLFCSESEQYRVHQVIQDSQSYWLRARTEMWRWIAIVASLTHPCNSGWVFLRLKFL